MTTRAAVIAGWFRGMRVGRPGRIEPGCAAARALRRLAPLLLPLATAACILVREEVERVSSPDGRVDAVVIRVNGGATVAYVYEVHLLPAGRRLVLPWGEAAGLYAVDLSGGPMLQWTDDGALRVQYLHAQGARVDRPRVRLAGRQIRVGLDSGVVFEPAPARPSVATWWTRSHGPFRPVPAPVVEPGTDPRADAARRFVDDSVWALHPVMAVRIAYAQPDSALVQVESTEWSTRDSTRGGKMLEVVQVRRDTTAAGGWRVVGIVASMHLSIRRGSGPERDPRRR